MTAAAATKRYAVNKDGDRLMRPGEVAKRLQVSRRTVGTWIKAGLFGSATVTPGGEQRVTMDAVIKFAEAHGYQVAIDGE